MSLKCRREEFEKVNSKKKGAILTFNGVDGYDVYNCSIPFDYKGSRYMYGRVEKREQWARSRTMLFEQTNPDEWSRVVGVEYQIEDPNITVIGREIVLNGTFALYRGGKLDGIYALFYRGTDVNDLCYFTTGPYNMKDIRLVQLSDGRIGVFSRPRNKEIIKKFGSESQIGFAIINNLDELTDTEIANAPYIPNLFKDGEWGGCNQVYLLDSGYIGIIGHKSYRSEAKDGLTFSTYLNIAFVFDPEKFIIIDEKIIATSCSYPEFSAKLPYLKDCAFTSGIIMRHDGKADLYSGLGDCAEGRIAIDYPFEGYGEIVPYNNIGY